LKYSLDSNTYIQAKNQYYHMEFCPAFWDWLDRQYAASELASIEMVYDELANYADELTAWVKERKFHFLEVSDESVQDIYAQIAAYVAGLPSRSTGEISKFLGGADPWLIAKAKHVGATLVTLETLAPETSKKIKIPNICREFDVSYINTFDLLKTLEAKFVLA